jgi:hypothetical protein
LTQLTAKLGILVFRSGLDEGDCPVAEAVSVMATHVTAEDRVFAKFRLEVRGDRGGGTKGLAVVGGIRSLPSFSECSRFGRQTLARGCALAGVGVSAEAYRWVG